MAQSLADFVNANVRLGRAKVSFKAINDAIFGFENIIIIYLAARLAVDNLFTVGMIFAFMSYKTQFVDRTVMLVEKVLDYRILGLHLERLADIALTSLERGQNQPLSYSRPIQGAIELRNVSAFAMPIRMRLCWRMSTSASHRASLLRSWVRRAVARRL